MATRYFALQDRNGKEIAVFTGKQPRQAALKAASRGYGDIFLRERGTKKVHHFRGERKKVKAPDNRPSWMAEYVWKPNVKKVELIKPKLVKKAAKRRAKKRKRR